MEKYKKIAEMLRVRIKNGDYAFSRIPGAHRIAKETGVSYMTARQAVQKLLQDNVIIRGDNGRLGLNQNLQVKIKFNVAFIGPLRHDNYYLWEDAVKTVCDEEGLGFRLVIYSHNEDPVITDVLNGDFDLVFISHHISASHFIANQVIKNAHKTITLFEDFTKHGVRCLDGPPPAHVKNMIRHLQKLGHKSADSFCVYSDSSGVEEKLDAWDKAISSVNMGSKRHRKIIPPFRYSVIPAYEHFGDLYAKGVIKSSAVFTPIIENAIGIIRYCHDQNIVIGRDLSVCSFGQPEFASMHIPSITVINRPDPLPQVRKIIRGILHGNGAGTKGQLMFRTGEGKVIEGESTGSPRVNKKTKDRL